MIVTAIDECVKLDFNPTSTKVQKVKALADELIKQHSSIFTNDEAQSYAAFVCYLKEAYPNLVKEIAHKATAHTAGLVRGLEVAFEAFQTIALMQLELNDANQKIAYFEALNLTSQIIEAQRKQR